MNIKTARILLTTVFLVAFLVQVGAVFYSLWQGTIYSVDLTSFLTKLLAIYSVHLTVILAGIFAQHQREGPYQMDSAAPFWLALSVASIWNLLLVVRTLGFAFGSRDSIDDLVTYLTTISSSGSFLVAGALTYCFSKRPAGRGSRTVS